MEQVGWVETKIPLFGRLFHYGSIQINLHGSVFTMVDMVDVEKFQEAIIYLQEAQKEGRAFRSDIRRDESFAKQTMAQVKAMGMLSQTISEALPVANNKLALESSEQVLIENA